MIGVVFSDESEAKTFYKKVTTKKSTSCMSDSVHLAYRP